MENELHFLPEDKRECFPQGDSITLRLHIQACPSTQNSRFAIFLQYLQREVSDEVDFLHSDKH